MLGAGSRCLAFEFSCLFLAAHAREQNRAENCCECGFLHNHTAECAAKSQRKCPIGRAGAVMRDLVHAAIVPLRAAPRITAVPKQQRNNRPSALDTFAPNARARIRTRMHMQAHARWPARATVPAQLAQVFRRVKVDVLQLPCSTHRSSQRPSAHRRPQAKGEKRPQKCRKMRPKWRGRRNGGALSPKLPSAVVQLGLFLGVRKPGWPRITICPSGWFEAGAAAWIARSKGDAPVTESAAQPVSPSSYLI